MRVLFTPKINYKPNLGIVVPAYFPYNIIAYFCWFSFMKNIPNIKPVFIVYGYPRIDMLPWARRLGYKILHIENNFKIEKLDTLFDWEKNKIIAFAHAICLRKFDTNQNILSRYIKLTGENEPNIKISNRNINEFSQIYFISDPEARDIAYRAINNIEIFDICDNCNKIQLSKIVKESLTFRSLVEKELSHETIQF